MPENIHHSEEIEEILSKPQSWMLRWGLISLLITIIILGAGSHFVSYPSIVKCNLIITTEDPPTIIKSYATGRIDTVLVSDGAIVNSGTIIALVESPEEFTDVLKLQYIVDSILRVSTDTTCESNALSKYIFHKLDLGEMQISYTELSRTIADHLAYIKTCDFEKQIMSLEEKKNILNRIIAINKEQSRLIQTDISLANNRYQIDSSLFHDEIITPIEYSDSRSTWLSKQNQYRFSTTTFLSNELQYTLVKEQENNLTSTHTEKLATFSAEIKRICFEINAQISKWKMKYVITSPTNGTVSIFDLKKNQMVNEGDELVIVTSSSPGRIIGDVRLPLSGSSAVMVDQDVKVKLSGFPYQQYGTITGRVSSISALPKDSLYHVRIEFPNGLQTNSNLTLNYQPLMTGQAEIITEKRTLLNRIFNEFTSLIR